MALGLLLHSVNLNRILLPLRLLDQLEDLDKIPIQLVVPLELELQVEVFLVQNLLRQDLEVGHLDPEQVDLQLLLDSEVIPTQLLKVHLDLVSISLHFLTNN